MEILLGGNWNTWLQNSITIVHTRTKTGVRLIFCSGYTRLSWALTVRIFITCNFTLSCNKNASFKDYFWTLKINNSSNIPWFMIRYQESQMKSQTKSKKLTDSPSNCSSAILQTLRSTDHGFSWFSFPHQASTKKCTYW